MSSQRIFTRNKRNLTRPPKTGTVMTPQITTRNKTMDAAGTLEEAEDADAAEDAEMVIIIANSALDRTDGIISAAIKITAGNNKAKVSINKAKVSIKTARIITQKPRKGILSKFCPTKAKISISTAKTTTQITRKGTSTRRCPTKSKSSKTQRRFFISDRKSARVLDRLQQARNYSSLRQPSTFPP